MDPTQPKRSHTYQILIEETLDRSPVDWFGALAISPQESGGTLLRGQFADQPALRGFMDHLWNLNLTILHLDRIDDDRPQ